MPTACGRDGCTPIGGVLDRLGIAELEVVCCMACGDEPAAIARYLRLPERTVRATIRRTVARLGLADTASLRLMAETLLGDARLAA
ncbi:MAG TPA: hypothetical protein VG939_20925 [Caulobacteraceae bacterium]|nr:hypothetical protein [Caulobacteraceae bacterium]